jgi:putative hydrolase of HD superfamily
VVTCQGQWVEKTSDEIDAYFNEDVYNPRDGELVQAADHLAAFLEAYLAQVNGMRSPEFIRTCASLKDEYRTKVIAGLRLGEIYADFE